jgi:transcription-repair coupling factor (superfamily II helicase)
VMALLDVALLRAAAAEVFITDITQKAGVVAFTFDSRVDVPSLMAVCTMPGYRSRLRLSAGEPPRLQLHLSPGEDALAAAGKLTEELRLKKEELGKAHEGGAT